MSCVNCAKTIEKQLSKLNGVIHATVNFAAEKAIVEYNPEIVNQKAIENAIVETGYRVIHEKNTSKSAE
jgi:Cu+-exporting ATPase